jgi:S1-C subfamily serine protease
VVLIGYPEGSRPPVPTLTTGAVTQVSPPRGSQLAMVGPRTIVIGTTAVGSPGYSGGPGIDDQGNAVGSTDFAPSELSKSTSRGTFLVSADDIRSELAQVGVTPRSGPGDVQRRAGFAAYDRGDYPAAAAAFHVCASLGAVNVQCADWEGFANDKQSPVAHAPPVSAAKPASSIGAPVLIGGAAVGAVILVAAVARLLIRRHRSRQRSWLGSSGGRR